MLSVAEKTLLPEKAVRPEDDAVEGLMETWEADDRKRSPSCWLREPSDTPDNWDRIRSTSLWGVRVSILPVKC